MAINNYGFPMMYQQQYPLQQTISNAPINVNQMHSTGIIWVQGEAGAKAYPVAPGNSVLLMDSETDCFFIKSTDASGVPSPLRTFTYQEVVPTQQKEPEVAFDSSKYVTRDEFDELKRMIQERPGRRENRNGEQAFSRNTKQQQQQSNE